ncbi:hypothetical protein G7072_16225 [Nocardioides sp. HDW12B]|uniref:PASTA domain-containing protein n=1 Tax=Nocardioides sp. HDW12B TaxID=2714939 RepID=UPI001408C186|nr:PASTA domain-containing protein [Nocardioides sp. HDW12B]QIK67688.1 hypothetical protein G7072_16225 [Nocardioides sp. HDW12B]
MLTENDARALLAQAADTIEVGPAAPVDPVRRRAWPLLVAAVGVLVAGVGVWAGVAALDDDATPDPAVDPAQIEPGTVPSVFGHQREEATRILTDAGLEVRVVERPACHPQGQALGTLPGTGVRMEPGSVVTLQVADFDAAGFCAPELTLPWQLLGLATGELDSPSLLSGPLTAYVDGERREVPDASDPAAWGSPSALEALRAAIDWAPEIPRTWRTLEQQEPGCDGDAFVPSVGAGTTVQRYAIEYDAADAPCAQLTVAGEFGKRPLEVAVETAGLEVDDAEPAPEPGTTVPAVFGLTEGEALAALEVAGVGNLVTVAVPECLSPGRALGTEPAAGAPITATTSVRLEVTIFPEDAECTSSQPEFFSLLDFARGERPPPFAGEVRTWVDGAESTVASPEDLGAWVEGSPVASLRAVADDRYQERAGADGDLSREVGVGDRPVGCRVGDSQTLPGAVQGRPATSAWVVYERGDETRACFLLDMYADEQEGIDALVVRTIDPDGLLPVGATSGAVGLSPQQDTADALRAFADNEVEGPPPLAESVTLLDRGDPVREATPTDLMDRDAWAVCAGLSDACGVSAIQLLSYAVDVPVGTTYPGRFGRTPTAPAGGAVVVLGPTTVTSCQPRGIIGLTLDADGRIASVDVAGDTSPQFCSEEGLEPPE